MSHRIPLSPEERPIQGYQIDIPLPPRPEGLVSAEYDDALHGAFVAERMPASATLLAQLEWAWGPMNNAIADFHLSLNRSREYWILWLGFFDDGGTPWHWERAPALVARRGKENKDSAAIHLFMDALSCLRRNQEYDHYHWINDGGCLGVYRIDDIAALVWKEEDLEGEEA